MTVAPPGAFPYGINQSSGEKPKVLLKRLPPLLSCGRRGLFHPRCEACPAPKGKPVVDLASVHITVYGHVQGVYFRNFTRRQAVTLGITGYARNLTGEEAVEVRAEGETSKLRTLIERLEPGPPAAHVVRIESDWSEYTGSYHGFKIRY